MFVIGLFFLLIVSLMGIALWASDFPRPFYIHGLFAVAALPLMWAAILHFVPVLTRSRGVDRGLGALPWFGMISGFVLLAVFAGLLPRHTMLWSAMMVGAGAFVLAGWIVRRSRAALGKPHPGVRWYVAALVCLMVGMVAAFGMVFDASRYPLWYRLHLHLNLFGWIGLTILGTLPVLLPTSLQKFEPNATFRLQIGLPWAVFGVFGIALGAALRQPLLGGLGTLILMGLLLTHWRAWFGLAGAPWRWPGQAVSLWLGSAFLMLLLPVGVIHAAGGLGGGVLLPAFAVGFLLPTVLGALAQLLPVWRYPGPDSVARESFRSILSSGAALRGVLCVLAGLGQLVGLPQTLVLAGTAVLWLLLAVLRAHRRCAAL